MTIPATTDPTAPNARTRWGNRVLLVLFAAVAVPVAATLLFTFSPTKYGFYPPCVFHYYTGLHCPGCGATRCVAALLHANVGQAFAYNPLFVLMLPFLTYGVIRIAYEMWTGKQMRTYRLPGWTVKLLLGLVVAYWIARNIDAYPFNLLAPHEI